MIGSLMYAAVMTRPDIAFAVSHLSQYLNAPRITHLLAVTRVFRYLSGTRDLKLVLGGPNSTIIGYSDSDWASQIHRHSISGFAFFIGSGVVSWSSKKQPIITLSSTEAEYATLQRISFGFINFLPNSLLFFLSLYLPLSFVIIKARSDSLKIPHSMVAPNILTFISILFDKLFPKTTSPSPIVQRTT